MGEPSLEFPGPTQTNKQKLDGSLGTNLWKPGDFSIFDTMREHRVIYINMAFFDFQSIFSQSKIS